VKVLVIDPEGQCTTACRHAAVAAGHVLELCTDLPPSSYAEAAFAEAVLLCWPGPRDTAAWVRQLRRLAPHLPLLALIQCGNEAAVCEALDAGIDEGLLAPVRPEELLLRLTLLQARRCEAAPAKLAVGDLRLDLAALCVTRAGLPVVLTAAEWRIVDLLARRRGDYVSAEAVVALLPRRGRAPKGGATMADSAGNRASVHIANLRRKLGVAVIQSRRGMGYRLAG
jgi:two-component system, OmpR family, response regulator